MRKEMTVNELSILKILNEQGKAFYKDIEPKMKLEAHDKYWTTFSTICSLIQAGVIVSDNKYPSTYSLTPYGKVKAKEVL
tara:strand:- start:68 stop:307 length:240 start_codon:yes stop_codon:yes gene_type:complete